MQSNSCCLKPWDQKNGYENNNENDNDEVGIDETLAKELNQLTVEEREKLYDDIHGVVQEQEETPEFLKRRFELFDVSISMIPEGKRKAYNRAVFLKPSLEKDEKFKLMFLRTDLYDSKKAAHRMVNFFEMKREVFGDEKLVKRITLSDLSEEELDLFRSGYVLQHPLPDRSGRPVLFFDWSKYDLNRISLDSIVSCLVRGDTQNGHNIAC